MENQNIANLKDLFKTHKFFYEVEIRKTDYFTYDGSMDWLVGRHIIALEENLTNDIFKLRFPKFITNDNTQSPVLYKNWPFKYKNQIIIPALYEDYFKLYENIDLKFKNLNISDIGYTNTDCWFLRDDEIEILRSIRIDLNLSNKEKIFTKKIIQKY